MDSSESFNSDPFTFAGTKRKKIYSPSQNRIFRSPAHKAKKSPRQVRMENMQKREKEFIAHKEKDLCFPLKLNSRILPDKKVIMN